MESNLKELKKVLFSLFASIPYNNYTPTPQSRSISASYPSQEGNVKYILHYEGFYASVIYTYFLSLGVKIIAEDVTNKGRVDLTVIINQIVKNNYHEKYLADYNEIYLVGIIFNEKKRNMVKFNHRKVKSPLL